MNQFRPQEWKAAEHVIDGRDCPLPPGVKPGTGEVTRRLKLTGSDKLKTAAFLIDEAVLSFVRIIRPD